MNTTNINNQMKQTSQDSGNTLVKKQSSGISHASASARSGASSVTKQFHQGAISGTSLAVPISNYGGSVTAYKSADFTKTRLLQELELVFKEYTKACEIEQSKGAIPFQKLQHHDPEKWKKKFKMLFEREKIIAFGKTSSYMIDLKKLSFNVEQVQTETDPSPRALRPLGKDVLALSKFWVLFLSLTNV